MKEIIISSLDHARISAAINNARSGGINAPINLNPLMEELDRAKILPPEKMPPDVVTMNSIVKMKYVNSSQTMQVQIVYPSQANPSEHKISVFSPVATALLGYRKGDLITIKVPVGLAELRISEIIYQPEAEGDLEL
ncbi:MAG: nucleoside diphosphate kinase regulator [Lentimicrobium sp.]|nr:nucleoside diphosphate kinase regulator [Lentimicrobium sp.]